MNPGDIKIIDRLSAVEAIKRLNEEDLRFLNNLIVERLNLISQARATSLMTRFTKGDRVTFAASDGRIIQGAVLRLIREARNIQWP
jgi:hypothetical protein